MIPLLSGFCVYYIIHTVQIRRFYSSSKCHGFPKLESPVLLLVDLREGSRKGDQDHVKVKLSHTIVSRRYAMLSTTPINLLACKHRIIACLSISTAVFRFMKSSSLIPASDISPYLLHLTNGFESPLQSKVSFRITTDHSCLSSSSF